MIILSSEFITGIIVFLITVPTVLLIRGYIRYRALEYLRLKGWNFQFMDVSKTRYNYQIRCSKDEFVSKSLRQAYKIEKLLKILGESHSTREKLQDLINAPEVEPKQVTQGSWQ